MDKSFLGFIGVEFEGLKLRGKEVTVAVSLVDLVT